MRQFWISVLGICAVFGTHLPAAAQAQTIGAPKFVVGDTWTDEYTVERGANQQQTRLQLTVVRASAGSIELSNKVPGSAAPASQTQVGEDWSRVRNVNGHQTIVNRPLSFPLIIGKTWLVEYTENNPNPQHSSAHYRTPYKVTGWEDVTVPAGTFHALKIEVEGEWSAVAAPAPAAASGSQVNSQGSTTMAQKTTTAASTAGGRTYKAFWYVPEVKRWVKAVEEYYGADGAMTSRYGDQLVSYKLAK
jgi:single-stranded DNA-binding protein